MPVLLGAARTRAGGLELWGIPAEEAESEGKIVR